MDSDSVTALQEQSQVFIERAGLDPAGREARVQASVRAYDNARLDGLCHEGAWECALEAARGFVAEMDRLEYK